MKCFDVIVIGGGHAGIEAASSSSRMGANTALITMAVSYTHLTLPTKA